MDKIIDKLHESNRILNFLKSMSDSSQVYNFIDRLDEQTTKIILKMIISDIIESK